MNSASRRSTIFALATPAGRGAIAVVRVSGPRASATLQAIGGKGLPAPRQASLRRLRTSSSEMVDEALVLWMPGPASFTGEDCVELHLHGGPSVVSTLLEELEHLGLTPAGPGEFTRRAFENGKLDLSQAEAIGDLVEAESSAQRRQALGQLGGGLSRRYDAWRDTLLDALSLLEAQIDFPDEEIPPDIATAAIAPLQTVCSELESALAETRGERVREGFRIALIGAPNVGKSSLLNAFAERDAAIVTSIAGTTRDVVEVSLSLEGQLVTIADTAGLRESEDPIEAEGVRRAKVWAETADVRIGVIDSTHPETLRTVAHSLRSGDIMAWNKADLSPPQSIKDERSNVVEVATIATPTGVLGLRDQLVRLVARETGEAEFPAATRLRHRSLLREAAAHLHRSLQSVADGAELAAEDVRLAVRSLERVTGRADSEAVLDRVFSSFCIGK